MLNPMEEHYVRLAIQLSLHNREADCAWIAAQVGNRMLPTLQRARVFEGEMPSMYVRRDSSFRLAAVVGLSALATLASAQAPAPMPFTAHQLKPNVYWIEGGGGNSGVIIGDKGVIVIDAKTTPAGGKELLDNIAKITPKPVTTVILTHSDGDHVNGLASFPTGIKIIAHENNKKEQETALAAGGRGAPPAGHLPTQVVT
jgi:beta-lactamase superfamily II metal-dependent hydrolase